MNNENTIYDNEKTEYQNHDTEATQYDATSMKDKEKSLTKTESKSESMWKKAAAGMGSGILLGSVATFFSSGATLETHVEENPHPEWTDGEIPVATSVNDDMSFSEAFDTARMEIGAGGVFEWNGNIYSTYTEDEWNNMTAEEKAEYGNHFSWHSESHNDMEFTHSSSSVSSGHINEDRVVEDNNSEIDELTGTNNGEELEITGVISGAEEDGVDAMPNDPEVQILGVMHDNELGANIGGLVVDGQEYVLIDVDGDGTFDVMGRDLDGNLQVSQEELVDISEHNLTIDDMGGMPMTDNLYTSDNGVDYIDDVNIL